MSFFRELKRRNVFRTGLGNAVGVDLADPGLTLCTVDGLKVVSALTTELDDGDFACD